MIQVAKSRPGPFIIRGKQSAGRIFLVALFAALAWACGPRDTHLGTLSAIGGEGGVAAYRVGWQQGYVLSPEGGVKTFVPAGQPTLVFATPDEKTALFVDRIRGWVTAVNISTGETRRFPVRTNRDKPEFSKDSRFVLWHASGELPPSGTFDPNELSLIDLQENRQGDLSVGSNPKAVVFFYKDGAPEDARMLLFSPGKMTQIRIAEFFSVSPAENWKLTRDLSASVRPNEAVRVFEQTDSQLFLVVNGLKEFLTVSLQSNDELPPVNFEINDVDSPRSLALGPPVPATAETVFFREGSADTRFLYVLNADKTLTVFDADNLGRTRVIDLSYVAQEPDTVYATPNGKRVLVYAETGARALYRMNVRTGNISTIPFERPVQKFVHAPDGESLIAIHSAFKGEPAGTSFTYVNFTNVYDPILLPSRIAEYAMAADGGHIVFRLEGFEPPRKFDLRRGLLDEMTQPVFTSYEPLRLGGLPGPGRMFVWMDDPLGRVAFVDLNGATTLNKNFVIDGILDR